MVLHRLCPSIQPLKNWRYFTRFCEFRNIFFKKKCLQQKVFLIGEVRFPPSASLVLRKNALVSQRRFALAAIDAPSLHDNAK